MFSWQRCVSLTRTGLICAAVFPSGESAVLSFVTWLSGAEQSGARGPSTENQEAKQAAVLCIKVPAASPTTPQGATAQTWVPHCCWTVSVQMSICPDVLLVVPPLSSLMLCFLLLAM